MPELPEVESLAAFLRGHATGHTVARADAASFSVLKTFDPPLTDLSGQVIIEVGRHGKFLDLATDQGLHLIMHLARAGWLRWRDDLPTAPPKPGKSPLTFRLRLDDGSGFDLTEQGSHKRLAVYLVRDPAEVPGVATLGPDPLAADFTRDTLAGLLAGRRMQVKGVLRDQRIIAGIGRAWANEILHTAGLSPFAPAQGLSPGQVQALADAMESELQRGLELRERGAKDAKVYRVHNKLGEPCHVCGTPIARVDFDEHTIYYCPECQTGGRLLKDRRLSRLLR
jgi:formamidopyrimidine-DNA glycosylase